MTDLGGVAANRIPYKVLPHHPFIHSRGQNESGNNTSSRRTLFISLKRQRQCLQRCMAGAITNHIYEFLETPTVNTLSNSMFQQLHQQTQAGGV
jgi:hypothetical protein